MKLTYPLHSVEQWDRALFTSWLTNYIFLSSAVLLCKEGEWPSP